MRQLWRPFLDSCFAEWFGDTLYQRSLELNVLPIIYIACVTQCFGRLITAIIIIIIIITKIITISPQLGMMGVPSAPNGADVTSISPGCMGVPCSRGWKTEAALPKLLNILQGKLYTNYKQKFSKCMCIYFERHKSHYRHWENIPVHNCTWMYQVSRCSFGCSYQAVDRSSLYLNVVNKQWINIKFKFAIVVILTLLLTCGNIYKLIFVTI